VSSSSSSGAQALVARWATVKEAVDAMPVSARVTPATLYEWCRAGLVLHRRSPGARGRVTVALDAQGFPIPLRVALSAELAGEDRS
jgi:hypothetical protein